MYELQKHYNTDELKSQSIIFKKLAKKKSYNKHIINYLKSTNQLDKAEKISNCATYIGITNINGVDKIIKADFCRERICNICAWRRQSKFIAQTKPIINILNNKGYSFIFVTLTLKNTSVNDLSNAIDVLLKGYKKLMDRRKYKRVWSGTIRSLEITYNADNNTFHPHIHILVAVKSDYFFPDNYITHEELKKTWQNIIGSNYEPYVYIEKVDTEEQSNATLETIKYSLKPSKSYKALEVFTEVLKGRRLISFTGIFANLRKELKLSNFEDNLLDDLQRGTKIKTFNVYKFDVTGGIYTFYNTYEL